MVAPRRVRVRTPNGRKRIVCPNVRAYGRPKGADRTILDVGISVPPMDAREGMAGATASTSKISITSQYPMPGASRTN